MVMLDLYCWIVTWDLDLRHHCVHLTELLRERIGDRGLALFVCSTVDDATVLGSSRSWTWLNVPLVVRSWETFLSVLGLSLLAHALWSTVFPNTTLMPAVITSAISLVIDFMVPTASQGQP